MSEIVLIHGSFHGGWMWDNVASALRNDGHTVHTPTMTGVGERSHLVSPQVGLTVNIQDIIQVFEYRDLRDVILVGHSYGGLVITGVAEAVPDRIKRLVYFDGFIPEDGESAWDIIPDSGERWQKRTEGTGTDWLVHPPDPREKYGVQGDLVEYQRKQMTPMAMYTHSEPIQLPENHAASLPRSYIECRKYDSFRPMARKAETGGFDFYQLDIHHNPILHEPEMAIDVLQAIVNKAQS